MTQTPERMVGYRRGIRAAIAWLHHRAAGMTDPHAVSILNSAAVNLGRDAQQAAEPHRARTYEVLVAAVAQLDAAIEAVEALEHGAAGADLADLGPPLRQARNRLDVARQRAIGGLPDVAELIAPQRGGLT